MNDRYYCTRKLWLQLPACSSFDTYSRWCQYHNSINHRDCLPCDFLPIDCLTSSIAGNENENIIAQGRFGQSYRHIFQHSKWWYNINHHDSYHVVFFIPAGCLTSSTASTNHTNSKKQTKQRMIHTITFAQEASCCMWSEYVSCQFIMAHSKL